MRIILAIGTRPEAIKMATLYLALKKDIRFTVKLCVTGQHSTMMDDALSAFDIIPDINLNVMSPNQSLNLLVSKIFSEFDSLIEDFNPDLIIVHGDTSSTMACSLASYLRRVKLMHVEAGLRTHNLNSPWPEEGNRQITSRVADFHFAPTLLAKSNLLKEGVDENKILITGNTVIDALLYSIEKLNKTKPGKVLKLLSNSGFIYNPSRKIILVTGHRRENFGQGFLNICIGLKLISEKFPEVDIVYPVHLNPSVKIPVTEKLGSSRNIHLIEPLGYLDFVWLMNKSYLILTDSGGIQEEAPTLKKPVIIMREITERPEAVDNGSSFIAGTSPEEIVSLISRMMIDKNYMLITKDMANPYGKGDASLKIKEIIEEKYLHG